MEIERGLVKTSAGYVHYRAAGQGRPLLLLHINQQSSALMLELMAVLGSHLRVIAPDYPSYGMSDHIAGAPTIGDYAGIMAELLDGLGIGRACRMGEAVGAAVTMELANAHPGRIEKIVMVNCPYYPDHGAAEGHHSSLKGDLRPTDPSGYPTNRTIEFILEKDPDHNPVHPTQSWMDRINTAQLEAGRERWQALNALTAYDIPAALEQLATPVLFIWGSLFRYASFQEEFTRRAKDNRALIVEGGRFCLTWERAEEVGQAALEFLG